jgi:hypothetical protein
MRVYVEPIFTNACVKICFFTWPGVCHICTIVYHRDNSGYRVDWVRTLERPKKVKFQWCSKLMAMQANNVVFLLWQTSELLYRLYRLQRRSHRAANNMEFSLNSPSCGCVLSTNGDLANTKSACCIPLRRTARAILYYSVKNGEKVTTDVPMPVSKFLKG